MATLDFSALGINLYTCYHTTKHTYYPYIVIWESMHTHDYVMQAFQNKEDSTLFAQVLIRNAKNVTFLTWHTSYMCYQIAYLN